MENGAVIGTGIIKGLAGSKRAEADRKEIGKEMKVMSQAN